MSPANGTEPLTDDELLYRRIPASQNWYTESVLSPEAYRPHKKQDIDGLSLWRAKHKSLEEVAHEGRPGREYYVAVLRVADLREHGVQVVATANTGGVGHVSLPALNAENRRTPEARALKTLLARKLTLRVEGPFCKPGGDELSGR